MRDRLNWLLREEQSIIPIEDYRTRLSVIADIADYLIDNGVIVPPCKVGDIVYYVSENPLNLSVQANTIYEADVVRIVTTHLGTSLVIQIRNEYGCTEIPDVNKWGKTVFLTREEAEKALVNYGSSKTEKGGK